MMDDPLTECPVCGGPVRRVVTSVGVVFKGSGFYVTDNRSSSANGKSTKAKNKDGKEGGAESADSAKSESGSSSASAPAPTPSTPAE